MFPNHGAARGGVETKGAKQARRARKRKPFRFFVFLAALPAAVYGHAAVFYQVNARAESRSPNSELARVPRIQVAKLKKALVERSLPTDGLKAVLAARLMEAMGH